MFLYIKSLCRENPPEKTPHIGGLFIFGNIFNFSGRIPTMANKFFAFEQ
jgi:hypothetical protein